MGCLFALRVEGWSRVQSKGDLGASNNEGASPPLPHPERLKDDRIFFAPQQDSTPQKKEQ